MTLTAKNHMTSASITITFDDVTLDVTDVNIESGDGQLEGYLGGERFPLTFTKRQVMRFDARPRQWKVVKNTFVRRDGTVKESFNLPHEIHW